MNFVAIDVETANADMSSICQIGIVEFLDGKIVEQWGSLINPLSYFDPLNVSINGITSEMVKDSPPFLALHKTIQERIGDSIVVTHMAFDQTSLHRASLKVGLPDFSCQWLDSARVGSGWRPARGWPLS